MGTGQAGRRLISPIAAVVLQQFLSSFADNINFFLIVGMVERHGASRPEGVVAYIQIAFLLGYVVLAPVVGAYADRNAKSFVLLIGNVLKGIGIALLFAHVSPVLCYMLLGIGAVVYSPAKYGILTELTATEQELLEANARLEGSAILAIVLGTIAGGFLARNSDVPGIVACVLIYAAAIAMTFLIPSRPGRKEIGYGESARAFVRDAVRLFSRRRSRFSLIGTSAFWMTATVLRIALIAWLPVSLGIVDTDRQSMIIGVTAVGVVAGSLVTRRLVPGGKLHRAYYYGIAMVVVLLAVIFSAKVWLAVLLLFLIGVLGGVFLIPLNTMLQEEGHALIGAGKTIAVQNFVENGLTVSGLLVYFLMTSLHVSVHWNVIGIGLILTGFLAYLGSQLGRIRP